MRILRSALLVSLLVVPLHSSPFAHVEVQAAQHAEHAADSSSALIDRRPAIIASCHGVADVIDAVHLARTLGLEDDAADAAAVAYGPNLPRLAALKATNDPENFFRHNVNIVPRSVATPAAHTSA